jgi:hypothetical protein
MFNPPLSTFPPMRGRIQHGRDDKFRSVLPNGETASLGLGEGRGREEESSFSVVA